MNIAIDCRYIGMSGIGRVCEGIIDVLDYSAHNYYLIGNADRLKKYKMATIIEDNTNPYSKRGLLKFNKKQINRQCDCIIIPNFIIPFGIRIPVHSVMHDLIFLDLKETVNGKFDYFVKKTLLKRCMKKSKSIACVSAFTKSRCEHYFKKHSKKCYVNYVGLAKNIIEFGKMHEKPTTTDNSIVYVGNVKKHKGLEKLLDAFEKIGDNHFTLKIIGEKNKFLTGLKLDETKYKNVEFTGRIGDEELFTRIQNARYLILPSLYEGFGAPPLEALFLGTQPIISDIEVFREIYADLPVVFINDMERLGEYINRIPDKFDCKQDILLKYNYESFTLKIIEHITYAS